MRARLDPVTGPRAGPVMAGRLEAGGVERGLGFEIRRALPQAFVKPAPEASSPQRRTARDACCMAKPAR